MSTITEIVGELHTVDGVTVDAEILNPGATEEEIAQLTAVFPVDESVINFYRQHNGCRIHWKGRLRARQWGSIQFRSIENLLAENGLLVCDEMNPENSISLITTPDGGVLLKQLDYDGHTIEPHLTFPQLLELLKLTRGYFNWGYYCSVQLTQRDTEFLADIEGDLTPLFPDFSCARFNEILGQ